VGKAPRAKSGLGRALSLALPRARSRSLPAQANAACFGCYVGAGIAAGLIGGALIAGATAPAYISGFEFATEFGRAIEREAPRGASFLAIG
jgi:hypothetical protein